MDVKAVTMTAEVLRSSGNGRPVSGEPRQAQAEASRGEQASEDDKETARLFDQQEAALQDFMNAMNISIAFSRYGNNNEKVAITVREKDTGKVIREIPSEEVQRFHRKMDELIGMLFSQEV
ncbi:MAG: flagellar protein FlaG [Deltaproteobacteria bacterium]|nr:flagellar protein FlaG [Deltaproteobacteria bacterium]